MRLFNIKKIRTKFLVPILLLQFVALGALGIIGYSFSSNILRTQSEYEFRTTIDSVYTAIETELVQRLSKIEQLISNPVFIKFIATPVYKSDADAEIFNFQKGNGLTLGEPEIGGLVNFPIGLIANEGNKKILEEGLFPSVEYVGMDGFVKIHVYLGGSNDTDFELKDRTQLDRQDEEWFKVAREGGLYVGKPAKAKLFLRKYQPVTFEIEEIPVEEELITIAAPHRVGSTVKGVFMVTTAPDFMKNALEKVRTDSLLLILDSKGKKIEELGDPKIMPKPSEDFLRRAALTPPDSIVDLDRRLLMRRTVPAAGWSIIMMGDKNLIFRSVYRLRNDIAIVMLVSLGIMAAIIFFIIKKLLAPVINLTKASDRIAGGELGVVIGKESEDEIGRLTESFNQMSTTTKEMHDRLLRMNFVRRQLLNIISHELRTPLNSVVGFYDLLQEEVESGVPPSDPKEFQELFASLGDSIERSKILVERLTKASLIMAAQIRSEDEAVEETNVGEAIAAICEATKKPARERGIGIEYPKAVSATVACPANAMRLMLEEAFSNAVKYSPDDGKISIAVDTEGGNARICIRDRGPGIPKEYIHDVVEPFFEIQDADFHSTGRFRKGAGGLGLGLTIIMGVLRQYRGSLDIGTPRGGGTDLIITLPLASVPLTPLSRSQ